MILLAASKLSSHGKCLLKNTNIEWVAYSVRVCRGISLRKSTPKTSVLRASGTAAPTQPQRWLQKEPLPMRGFSAKHKKDGVPANFSLIYRNYMNDKLLLIFYGLGATFTLLMCSVYFVVTKLTDYDDSSTRDIPYTGLGIKEYFLNYGIICACIMIMPLFVHTRILRKSILRIYYNSENDAFVGIFKNGFRKSKTEFTMKDIAPVVDARTQWRADNITIKDTAYIVFESDFIDVSYVAKFMRY